MIQDWRKLTRLKYHLTLHKLPSIIDYQFTIHDSRFVTVLVGSLARDATAARLSSHTKFVTWSVLAFRCSLFAFRFVLLGLISIFVFVF